MPRIVNIHDLETCARRLFNSFYNQLPQDCQIKIFPLIQRNLEYMYHNVGPTLTHTHPQRPRSHRPLQCPYA